MNAKYIFNAVRDYYYAGTIGKMADLAVEAGYYFFVFNEKVYHVTKDKVISETGLTKSDIFCYLC